MIKNIAILFFCLFSISCSKGWLLKLSGNYTCDVIIENWDEDAQSLVIRDSNQSGEIMLDIKLSSGEVYVWEEIEPGKYFFENFNGDELIKLNDWTCYVDITGYSGVDFKECCSGVGGDDCSYQ